jgi:hypothetical protein
MYNDPYRRAEVYSYTEAHVCADHQTLHVLVWPTASTRRHGPRALAAIISEGVKGHDPHLGRVFRPTM